uniref:Amidase domain-containing protein n=2 Tax=Lutzomyia longipalpis TaxID=7200 RepID=A0A1B0CN79_LUTLO
MPRNRKATQSQNKTCEILKGIAWGILTQIILIIHILVDKLLETVLEWYWKEKKTCSSLRENFFITKSATEIAGLIRKGELTSYQVCKAYIDRMKEVNPQLNAIADGPFESALEEAKKIDERLEKHEVSAREFAEKPFLGVPFTTKDSTAVKGALHTLGLLSRATERATEDAECVRLMKEAGAICVATTTVPEVNRWQETRNNVTGITNNPYDLRRTVGGSSGGEAAVISACGSAFGIGTDIGGSIRMPAFYCGIYGHKPTSGLVNMRGTTFRTGKEKNTMVVAGPMTRYAKDLLPIFKEAGAICVATTTVPEVNRWQETRNNVTGITNNPYDLRRTVGGSSGGEAAVISACGSAFGIGTDIGGSIRMPAFYCGIYGHKPTSGLVNMRGTTFRTGKEKNTMVAAGPMTRYAKDLLPIFKPNVRKLRYMYLTDIKDLKVAPVGKDMLGALRRAIRYIDSIAENPCVEVTIPGTEMTSKMWRHAMRKEPQGFDLLLGNGQPVNPIVELVKKLLGQSDFTLASIYSLIDGILPAGNVQKIEATTRACGNAIKELLGDDGVLLVPSAPSPASFHYAPLVQIYKFSYWSLFNCLHLPATQIPLGLDSRGLPLGLQIVAAPNCDRLCLAVAEEIENSLAGWKPPFTTAS